MLLSDGQMSDHKGARLILDALPPTRSLIADRGDDSAWFRIAQPRTPFRIRQGALPPATQGREPFPKLKDWCLISTRYNRCAHTFFPAICIAAAVIFWL